MDIVSHKPQGLRVLHRKHGCTYYFQRRIPAELAAHYPEWPAGKIDEKLPTSDRREAGRLTTQRWAALDAEFARLRATGARQPSKLDPSALAALLDRWKARELAEDEAERACYPDGVFDELSAGLSELDQEGRRLIARRTAMPRQVAVRLLADEGIALPEDGPDVALLAAELPRAMLEVVQALAARQRGDIVDTPAAPPPLSVSSAGTLVSGKTLDDALLYWQSVKSPTSKTAAEARTVVTAFLAVPGTPATVGAIRRAHVIAYRDAMISAGKSPPLIKKNLSFLSTIFERCINGDAAAWGLEVNPAWKVEVPKDTRGRQRTAFDLADLQRLFCASPVYASGVRSRGGAGEAQHWLPLLALFTGARLGELGQLCAADVQQEGAVLFLHIIDNPGEGRTTKTGKTRRVPIHPELVRLGFLAYVQQVRRSGAGGRLFPRLESTSASGQVAAWSKWFGRYLRKQVGVTDPRKTFHSLRHTFKHFARTVAMPEDHMDAICGHDPGEKRTGRGYGGDLYPLPPLADSMARFQVPGLDLSHLYPEASAVVALAA